MDQSLSDTTPLTVGITDIPEARHLSELERFAEIGRLSAGLLHEIINPLTAARLWLEECNLESPYISHARNSIYLMQRYIDAARQQVRRESRRRRFCVTTELEQVRHILTALARRKGISLRFARAGRLKVYGDPVKFQQIVANLARNAMDSYDDGLYDDKMVRLDVGSDRGYLIIKVRDNGCGIAPERLGQVFQPFYSTKSAGGLGIGLTAVKQSVEDDFGGSIRVDSRSGAGTTFTVRLKLEPRQK